MTTIAAISTPCAPAGLGVLRLSGAEALPIACRVFRAAQGRTPDTLAGYTALYGHVYDVQGTIDECVILVFRAPHSYTGEDVVEFSCHGGLYLLQRTLRALLTAGAVPAAPGEFTRRAFVNGKLDLTRAEAVMELIGAQGKRAATAALAAREGALFHALTGVKQKLLDAAAQFSAFVDYPDDEIPALMPEALTGTLADTRETLSRLLATFDAGRVLREGIDTVIVGSPNVGKSTLMNCLSGCERSIVTPLAGTTRDVVEETVHLGDVLLRLSDTAGIRDTDDMAESIGVERARTCLRRAALLLVVFDGTRPLSEEDLRLIDAVADRPCIAIVNKADAPRVWDPATLQCRFAHVIPFSALREEGLEALTQAVACVTGVEQLDETQPLLATERQRLCAVRCLGSLEEAMRTLAQGLTLDAVFVHIDEALAAVLELTGERATEAVVETVFARFCVGK